jgi:hypothetical protein
VAGNATNGTRSYTANGLNQYTAAAGATINHDANGNLTGDGTWSYGYDQNNRLRTATKAGTSATLAYDAEGRMRQSVVNATTANLLYDGVALVAEYDAGGSLQNRWVHGPGIDEPLVAYAGATTANKSWLYTSTAIYSYGPYGEPNITSGQRFRYTGQQLIGGLDIYYYKARVYVAHCQGRPRGVCASWRRPLEDFVHRFIAEMIKAGAAPVIGDITAPFGWSPVLKYGEDPTKVADALVSEWLASKSDPDVDGIWFAFQAVWK